MKRIITFREAIREGIKYALIKYPESFVLGEDVAVYQGVNNVTGDLYLTFGPDKIMDTPISETAFLGCAVGAAMMGMKPIVELQVADFISVCLDPLMNQAAKLRNMSGGQINIPMVLRAAFGAGLGAAAQHSQSLESIFAHIPGLKVIMPATPYDAKGLFASAIKDPNPVVYLEPRAIYNAKGDVPIADYEIPIGKADIKRKGTEMTIITYGSMLEPCLLAAENIAETHQIDIEVLDLRSLQPLDTESIIKSCQKTKRVMIVHEAVEFLGMGAEIAAKISETEIIYQLQAPIKRVAAKFSPIPFSKVLEYEVIPTKQRIEKEILAMFEISL